MIIQLTTDHHIKGSEKFKADLEQQINEKLSRFSEHLARVEVHLADENGNKPGPNDKRCTLEARIEGRPPMAVTNHGDTYEEAITGALGKLKSTLERAMERMKDH